MDISALSAEFPRSAVHWRAQTLTKGGDKALALAYLDARDVMDRLDAVCGPANWQSHFDETAKGRVICRLSIRIGDEWITKSDGAGDTAVEGEKGGISDALKRAAVSWGVGRYLYRLPAVWTSCESYEDGRGKRQWKAWRGDPWDGVRATKAPAARATDAPAAADPQDGDVSPYAMIRDALLAGIAARTTEAALRDYWADEKDARIDLKANDAPKYQEVLTAFEKAGHAAKVAA